MPLPENPVTRPRDGNATAVNARRAMDAYEQYVAIQGIGVRRGRLRVTYEALAKALGLPREAVIEAVFETEENKADRTFTVRVSGIGEQVAEVCQIPYVIRSGDR